MKIPMEIPEATVNATKEIVDFEAEAEMVSVDYLHCFINLCPLSAPQGTVECGPD
jgi:hypothetical protein